MNKQSKLLSKMFRIKCLKKEISFDCRNKGAEVNNSICIGANRTNYFPKQKKKTTTYNHNITEKNKELPNKANRNCYSQRQSAAKEGGAVSKRRRGGFEKVRAGRG
jgi:hypothetical protein